MAWGPRRRHDRPGSLGGEYLTFWYVGQISHDAVSYNATNHEFHITNPLNTGTRSEYPHA